MSDTTISMDSETATTASTATAEPAKKAAKPKKVKVGSYPFRSKRSIIEQVEADDAYMLASLLTLHAAQTAHEQENKTTKTKNKSGFMSSHAVRGCTLAEKVNGGEELTDEDISQARGLVLHYGRQLAAFERAAAISANPELKRVARVFSAA
jgi:hypothetical protein